MLLIKLIFVLSALFMSAQAQNNETHRVFPEGFLFGVATASYQVEGGWNASDKGENVWDRLTHYKNTIQDGSSGDVACDSYNQYTRDVEMLKELGVNYYRFSLSWSRILPTGFDNKISADGIAYYNNLINLLLENNITPAVTLYHWDLPQPLQDIGGWPNPLIEKYFADYARVAFEAFGDRVKEWLTFNEPLQVCLTGYGNMEMAPQTGIQGISEYLCTHTLLKAHARAYHLYDEVFRPTQNGRVGLTLDSSWFEPEDANLPADVEASDRALQFNLGWYAHPIFSSSGDYPTVMKERIGALSQQQGYSTSRLPSFTPEEVQYIKGTFDFFGLNHYTSSISRHVNSSSAIPRESFNEDMAIVEYQSDDWPTTVSTWLRVVPWGMTKLLVWIKEEYNNPEVIVFENGYSDLGELDDQGRINFYFLYLNAVLDAIEQGVNVSAFTAWSLMDNFEWMMGYTEKFGLFYVDFNNPSRPRTPKASVSFFKELIRTKTLARP